MMAVTPAITYRVDDLPYDGVLSAIDCADCGIPFGIDVGFERRRRGDHRTFYCPNGHSNYYPQQTPEEKERERRKAAEAELEIARKQRDAERVEAAYQRRSAAAQKGARTRLLNRIRDGHCPFCSTEFANVRAHIRNQHADEYEERVGEPA